jgi:hypothetical protein
VDRCRRKKLIGYIHSPPCLYRNFLGGTQASRETGSRDAWF